MNLHQNCFFNAINIEGVNLSYGTHTYAELATNFPNNFTPGGSGTLTMQPFPPPPSPPALVMQPVSVSVNAGNPAQLTATTSGTAPLAWQ